MSVTRVHAEARYRELRSMAHQKAAALVADLAPVQMRDIERSALEVFATTWANNQSRLVAWPWPDMAADFRRKFPERFEVAIWSDEILCGLAIGKPSHSRHVMTVQFLEGNPDTQHPLKGIVHLAVLEAAHAYSVAINAGAMRIDAPHPATIELYLGLGFRLETPSGRSAYCEKEI